ncbi:MAG: rhodanese-like domain-containing protein [Cyclobacteriaceae bacterium]|nr:rhodanese-like domain-containing protein [Cyclobacteriaceae bacterium]
MKIEQIYTGCLAEAAYYIESKGEVAIIDPLRETEQYIKRAEKDGAKIKYIFETHFHADFVSGHVDLANKTGAKIVYGPSATAAFDFIEAEDNQLFKIGDVTLKVLHTPGHTLESSTFLLIDEDGKNQAIFTGDTLFLGDVGRPDLAVKSDLTREGLASMLFDSLRNKIMTLEDELTVYPGHGAGSACGKNMSSETVGKLGEQKKTNYALRADMTREEFIEELLHGILPPPQYFPKNAMLNKSDLSYGIDKVLEKGNVALDVETFEGIANHEGAIVLDVRNKEEFSKEHIPNAIFIGLDGSFAPWVGGLITDLQQPIILVTPEGKEEETITRLTRVGYDNTLGYLKGGIEAWKSAGKDIEAVETINASTLGDIYSENSDINIMDVRKIGEYQSEHVLDAESIPLDYINEEINKIQKDKKYYIHCKSGYRSLIAASILKSRNFHDVVNVDGGFDDILKEERIAKSAYVCPSKL